MATAIFETNATANAIRFYNVRYMDGIIPRVDAGYRDENAANRRAEILRARGMRMVNVYTYTENR